MKVTSLCLHMPPKRGKPCSYRRSLGCMKRFNNPTLQTLHHRVHVLHLRRTHMRPQEGRTEGAGLVDTLRARICALCEVEASLLVRCDSCAISYCLTCVTLRCSSCKTGDGKSQLICLGELSLCASEREKKQCGLCGKPRPMSKSDATPKPVAGASGERPLKKPARAPPLVGGEVATRIRPRTMTLPSSAYSIV